MPPLPLPPLVPYSDVLLEKHYKGIIGRGAVETFWEEVSKRAKRDVRPLRAREGANFVGEISACAQSAPRRGYCYSD
jgi:hypothetical protein